MSGDDPPAKRNAAVPNPARPGTLRPVDITDRAKRYRANATPPPGPRTCHFCTSRKNIDIDHVDGNEGNGEPFNLIYLCRTCNARKGIVQSKANVGTRTRQYNPRRNPGQQPSFRQYVDAVLILRGDRPGNVRAAGAVIQRTDDSHRAKYTRQIAAARNPNPEAPTFAQYAYAVAIHTGRRYIPGQGFTRGNDDEGGAIIHATPKALRTKYARQIAAGKRQKGSFQ